MNQMHKPRKNSFFNLYFTATVSIALVLFMVGLIVFLLTLTQEIAHYTKEHVTLSLVLNDEVSDADVTRIRRYLEACPFVKSNDYISKEAALQEHIEEMGEDPTDLLGFNPLRASIEVCLQSDYANTDSIGVVKQKLQAFRGIEEFVYQQDMLDLLNQNVNKASMALALVALVLLFISIVLINNTIRISIYSKRFIIKTMQLVGARSRFIRKPFMRRAALNSVVAAVLALVLLGGSIYYVQREIGDALSLYRPEIIVPVVAVVTFFSFVIILLATLAAVNRYLRMRTDDLFFV